MTKTPENLITQHFDTWTQAIETKSTAGRGSSNKLNLVGIQKLRELILEMAVRGLLVPQDSNNEPTNVLLEKIEAEKAQLIKDKKIKKTKALPEISEDEKPFDLPSGWEWVRLGEIGNVFNGNSVSARLKAEKYTDVTGLPYIGTKDVGYGFESFDYENGVNIPFGEPKFKVAHQGAVLVCAEGGSAGKKCGIAQRDVCFGNKLFANELYADIEPKFILSLYLSPSFFERFSEVMTGIIGGISRANFLNLTVQLPPLKEQKRIVAKVDELMALCDQLESQTLDSIATHQTLVETLLGNLVNPNNTANIPPRPQGSKFAGGHDQAWSLIAENFDVLFTTEKSIDTLKQTILQLAVMGKLVPQNPNDEPASKLLKKIAAEKAKLIADKKIKKTKPLPEITEAEKPFDLPSGWEWVKLNEIISMMDAGWSPACPPEPSPDNETWGVLKTTSVQTLQFLPEENKLLPSSKEPRPQYEVKSGDILVTRAGPWNRVGISCLVKETRPKLMTSDKLIRFHLVDVGMSEEYMVLALQSGATAEYLESCKSGMASSQVNISQDKLKAAPIPLPALEEQTRILAKVNELITLCDQLKSQLQIAQQTQTNLAQSIAQEALARNRKFIINGK